MMGSRLLAVWRDFLHLADAVLDQHLYSVERMFADMWRWQEMLKPAMAALSAAGAASGAGRAARSRARSRFG